MWKCGVSELKLGDAASTRKRDDKGDVDELTSPLKTLGLVERVDLDFTDHLWNVLQGTTHNSTLSLSLA